MHCHPFTRRGPDSSPRWLILQLERCSAPFSFNRVIVDRDNDSSSGANAEDENLMPAWVAAEKSEVEVEKPPPDIFHSSEGSVAKSKPKAARTVSGDHQAAMATAKRPAMNAACPRMSSFGNHRICPLRIMFIVSIP
jgi:hypothetical protein